MIEYVRCFWRDEEGSVLVKTLVIIAILIAVVVLFRNYLLVIADGFIVRPGILPRDIENPL